jgi:hypothetical protein
MNAALTRNYIPRSGDRFSLSDLSAVSIATLHWIVFIKLANSAAAVSRHHA